MQLLLVATATALAYAVDDVFMKLSNGYISSLPTVLSYILFAFGVHLQIYLLTHNSSLGTTGIFVGTLLICISLSIELY